MKYTYTYTHTYIHTYIYDWISIFGDIKFQKMKQMKMIILYIFQLEFILHIVGKHDTQYADLTIFSKFKMAAKKQNGCFKTIKESKS